MSANCNMGIDMEEGDVNVGSLSSVLRGSRESFIASDQEKGCEMFLPSTSDARLALNSRIPQEIICKDRLRMKAVADWVVGNKDVVAGDAADWHNLVNRFFVTEDYSSALAIAQAGRSRFPYHSILLGDEIRCAGNLGDWKLGDALVEQASSDDYHCDEDWALAIYVADYLKDHAHAEDEVSRQATYEKALDFLRQAAKRIQKNDQILNAEAEVLIEANRIDEARDLLEDAIFMRDSRDGVPNPMRKPVAQCCTTYLQKILQSSCDYEKIIEVAEAGIRFTATGQESASLGYFVYRKALAMDGLINANGNGTKSQSFGNQDYVRNALKTYALAYALDDRGHSGAICKKRFLLLSAMGGIDDMSIMEYCSEDSSCGNES